MALQVWLPLNKDLHNQGLFNTTLSTSGSTQSNYARKFTSSVSTTYSPNTNTGSISFGGWFKFNKAEIATVVEALSYTSTYLQATGTLLGNSNYGGIGLNWDTNNIYNDGSFTTLNVLASIRSTTIGHKSTRTKVLTFDEWVHIFYVFDKGAGTIKLFINGSEFSSITNISNATDINTSVLEINKASVHGGNYRIASIPFLASDIRIYDHALSTKEVKELAKGLYLHYTFNDAYVENTVNYAPYPSKTGDVGAIGWDQSKHVGAITVNGWTNGYNSGVSTPAQGYHAMWNMIDNIPTMVFNDKNSEIGITHRWLGINSSNFSSYYAFTQGTTYTISFDAKSTVNGKCISGGFYYTKQGATSGSFNDGKFNKFVTTEWQRYSQTFTVQYVVENARNAFYFYGYESGGKSSNPEATSYVRNVQIELKDHSTPYTPSSRTITTIRDNSGFGNDGTINGSLQVLSGSARGNYCTKLQECTITASNLNIPADSPVTLSFWNKPTNYSNNVDTSSVNIKFANFRVFTYVNYPYFKHDTELKYKYTNYFSDGKWHLFTCTYDGTTSKIYIDGELITLTIATESALPLINDFISYFKDNSISDLRLYKTVLSESDIKNLYKDSLVIDKNQNGYTYELNESDSQTTVDVKKNGQLKCKNYSEVLTGTYDNNVYVEPDGSVWIRIFHHNNPANALFSSSDSFNTGVYKDADRWLDIAKCNLVDKWEFMVKQKTTSTATENKYRWIQTKNPITSVFDDVDAADITKISGSGYTTISNPYGGIYKYTSGNTSTTYMVQNNGNNGNWWGAIGSWTLYQDGLPGFCGNLVTTGYMDLYLCIYDPTNLNVDTYIRKYNSALYYEEGELEVDDLDYFLYEGQTTMWNGQLCYIWNRYEGGELYSEPDGYISVILSNTLDILQPINSQNPAFVAFLTYDDSDAKYVDPYLERGLNEGELPEGYQGKRWIERDENYQYTPVIPRIDFTKDSQIVRIGKNGRVTANQLYEI